MIVKVNQLLDTRNEPRSVNFKDRNLPYFAEQVPVNDELRRNVYEGAYIDLNNFTMSSEEETFYVPTNMDKIQKPKRRISSYHSWAAAWNIYEALLMEYNPTVYKQCAEYRNFILDCSTKYQWESVALFDIKHRVKLSASRSFNFGTIDHTLFITTFDASTIKKRGACFRCKRTDHLVKNCPFLEEMQTAPQPSATVKQSNTYQQSPFSVFNGKEICNKFQDAKCFYPECKRAHVCRICKGPAPYSRCRQCNA